MAIVTQTINVDLRPHYNRRNQSMVYCSQYDNDLRNIVLNIANEGVPVDVSTYTIYIEGTKPDKHGFTYELTSIGGSVSNNVITVPLQTQMTAAAGLTNAEVVLYSNDERIGSANFILNVEKAGLAEDVDISETDIPAYVDGAQQAAAEATQAKDDAVSAKDTAVSAAATAQTVLDSIPADYSDLSDSVDDLKNALNNITGTTKNLYDPDAISHGYYESNGTFTDNQYYICTDFIPVANNQYIALSFDTSSISSNPQIAVFDSNKQFIERGTNRASGSTYRKQNGDGYVRFACGRSVANLQIEYGSVTDYIPHFTAVDYVARSGDTLWYSSEAKPPYWILHVDCARKFISVANIKTLIDNIANAGFNQFQFHFSDDVGFRFELDDMTFTDVDGNDYDLTSCLGGNEASTSWYTQANVDEIITYAKSKRIELVPSLDMPGHMNRILATFPQFKYGASGTLDITNATAVKFACAIAEKYMRYFADKGCYRWNMGYDEIVSSTGLDTFYNNGEYRYVTDFAEKIREVAQKYNLTLRMYNEPVYYNQDVNFYVNRDIEVLYWYTDWAEYTLPVNLMRSGYKLINNSYRYYWILSNPEASVTVDTLNSTNLLTDFYNYAGALNGYGAVLSIWCDSAGSHSSAGDGGAYIVAQTASLITAFGNAIQRAIS